MVDETKWRDDVNHSRLPWEALQMFARRARFANADCDHTTTVVVRNAGLERTVCESCGRVSIRPLQESFSAVDRSRFERPVERASR